MPEALVTYIPSYFTRRGIVAFIALTIITFLLFIQRAVPVLWMGFSMVEVVSFFIFSSKLSVSWSKLSIDAFPKRLYRIALSIRLIWVLFSHAFFIWMTGTPFEFDTADALGYYNESLWLAGLLRDNKWQIYVAYIGKNYADMGYPLYLGLLSYISGDNVLLVRLIKAILGGYTCLFTYKIARNNFGESTGRMAGIMAMLLPNLIYYCGLHVKETEMVFLATLFVYQADRLIRKNDYKVKLLDVVWLGLVGASLFFFRTVLAGCLFGSLAIATFFTSGRVSAIYKRVGLIILLVAGVSFIAMTPLADKLNEYLKGSDQNLNSQMDHFAVREGGNKMARYGSRSIFLPFMLMAPFPTLVDTNQPNAMMLAGAFFTRNVYAFFVFIALWVLYKYKQLRDHLLLLSIIASYLFVLASSGFALSERFHLPIVPFLLTLAAFGVSQMNRKNAKYYVPYLVLVTIIILGWNWFKLAGRS